ncbi:MAG TPA: LysM peptidoglycan-binding domain-containing protein [Deltaproteobacteria bacterium]|nr:LysM peptidoglycan-binding domain-containing protein [Deltaproteobacteria bacterium]
MQLTNRIQTLEREIRRWAWATTGITVIAIGVVVASLSLGGDEPGPRPAPIEAPELVPPTPRAPAEVRPAAEIRSAKPAPQGTPSEATPHDTLERAKEILLSTPSLEEASITLGWRDGILVVDGEVTTYRQRKAIERVLRGVPGVGSLDLASIDVLSRLQGTTHVVQPGDTLSHIAYAYYGDSALTHPIEEANGVTAHSLQVGKELLVPPLP